MSPAEPTTPAEPTDPAGAVAVVVDPDAARAGTAVRARLDAGEPVAGFVGEPDDPAVTAFVADALGFRAPGGPEPGGSVSPGGRRA